MITETQRILGSLSISEIQALKKLVHAQSLLANERYMGPIHLPSLEDKLTDALNAAIGRTLRQTSTPIMRNGEVDMGDEDGVSYKIIFQSSARIPVIKLLRALWNYGLKEAKDISDLAWNSDEAWNTLIVRNDIHPNLVRAQQLINEVETLGRRQGYYSYHNGEEPFARIEAYIEPAEQT